MNDLELTDIPDTPQRTCERGIDKKIPFRKVFPSMWNDEKFRALSPCAQLLWTFLLTGPCTTQLPGLIARGRLGLSEDLGWSTEDFDRCWGEIEAQGMAQADWKARLVWLPNAVHYNAPDNPNVVKGWARAWREVPKCELKEHAKAALEEHMRERGENFVDAFAFILRPHGRNRSRNGFANRMANQEQEQEQEQREETTHDTPPAKRLLSADPLDGATSASREASSRNEVDAFLADLGAALGLPPGEDHGFEVPRDAAERERIRRAIARLLRARGRHWLLSNCEAAAQRLGKKTSLSLLIEAVDPTAVFSPEVRNCLLALTARLGRLHIPERSKDRDLVEASFGASIESLGHDELVRLCVAFVENEKEMRLDGETGREFGGKDVRDALYLAYAMERVVNGG